jgi:hypothetical protein
MEEEASKTPPLIYLFGRKSPEAFTGEIEMSAGAPNGGGGDGEEVSPT